MTENGFEFALLDRKYRDVNPLTCGHEKCEPGHTAYGMREYYLIHYVERGRGKVYADGTEYEVCGGQIFIIRPHEIVRYEADERTPWEYVWVGFNGVVAERIDTLSSRVLDFSSVAFQLLKGSMGWSDTREEIVTGCLYLIFAELFSGRSTHPHYVRRAVDYINALYMKDISVEGIADMLNMDRRYLTRIFKEKMGKSVQEYIIEVRMEHARELLHRGVSVTLAAELVGYPDPFNFSKMFRKTFGESPKQFAMRLRRGGEAPADSTDLQ